MEHYLDSSLLQRPVRVTVVGAGGTGSTMLMGLAQLHLAMRALGHPGGLDVTVFDGDTVSQSNIGRQMFYPSDVGQFKAIVLVNRINLSLGVDWKAKVAMLDEGSRVECDLVIGCVDTRKARKAIASAAASNSGEVYWLDIGNRLDDGQVILGQLQRRYKPDRYKPRLPHVLDLFPEAGNEELDGGDDIPSCSLADALERQSLFINRGVSLYALNMLSELFRMGKLNYHGVFVNLKAARTSPLLIDESAWKRFGYKVKKKPGRKPAMAA